MLALDRADNRRPEIRIAESRLKSLRLAPEPALRESSREFGPACNKGLDFEAVLSVRALYFDIEQLLIRDGAIARRDHPELQSAIRHLVRRGELAPVLPGVYVRRDEATTVRTRVRALMVADPNAVVTGRTAAHLSFWPQLPVDRVTAAVPHTRTSAPQGYCLVKRKVPPELIVQRNRVRLTSPALTALDLSDDVGGDAIDHALRSRMTTLAHLHEALALTPSRNGNRRRRQLLLDSRDEPWSAAERRCHRLLRSAMISGWRANLPVEVDDQVYFTDVGFKKLKLALEIDGREHHIGVEVFETDRWRQNRMVLDGWLVLRFTWRMLEDHPDEVIEMVRRALALREMSRIGP
jgi:very-short-patch-repair endonuclease